MLVDAESERMVPRQGTLFGEPVLAAEERRPPSGLPEPWMPHHAERGATDASPRRAQKVNEAKRSLLYMAEAVLEYGKVSDLDNLMDRLAALRQYKPFNALLVLLQRPAATYVLPAHHWSQRYGYVVRAGEQPLVLLQRGGPVMFLFDRSQVEPGPGALPLPDGLENPYGMTEWADAEAALVSVARNAAQDGVRVGEQGLGIVFGGYSTRSFAAGVLHVEVKGASARTVAVPVEFEVLLNSAYSATERLATLAHELGHIYCGHLGERDSAIWPGERFWPDRRWLDPVLMEVEAHITATIVMRTLIPDVVMPDHPHQFGAAPTLEGLALEPPLTAAGRILEMHTGRRCDARAGEVRFDHDVAVAQVLVHSDRYPFALASGASYSCTCSTPRVAA